VATNLTASTARIGLTQDQPTLADRFSRRNDVFGPSIWTEILKMFQRHPDPVYFGDGSPDRSLIPLDRLKEASIKAWNEAPSYLGYGDQQGYELLRELIVERMANQGVHGSADRVLVTSGSTQGIDLACRVFLDEGDVVLAENPTFLGATELFRAYGARIAGIDTDNDGMRMDSLEAALRAEPRAKFIYTIPTFQNPTGTTMPLDRRHRLVELAREWNVAILEDDPYVELRYDGDPVPALVSLDPQVIYLGTFSKTIAPGIRTGWTLAPAEVHRLLLSNREVADISNDRVMMRTVYHTAHDFLIGHVATTLPVYRSRRDAMLGSLDEFMPAGVTWSRPNGGFFIWITLPDELDTGALADTAATNGVIYFPGKWFFPDEDRHHTLRLSYSTVPEARITEGVRRLADTIRDAIER
jgi:2-aminoadipate transaminase